jgi:hypothetical protein
LSAKQNWSEFAKIVKNLRSAVNPSGIQREILEATGKTVVMLARQRARKATHAMEKSTDYQMISDTQVQCFVGVTYGRWQDEGTKFMDGNQFFSSSINDGWIQFQRVYGLWIAWLQTHEFAPGFKVPNSVGVSGQTTGTVKGKNTKSTIRKTIRPTKKYKSKKRGSKGWIYTY